MNNGAAFRARLERGAEMVAIHARDDAEVDALGAYRLALAVERAPAEALSVGGAYQGAAASRALGLALRQEPEMGELGPHEERGGANWGRRPRKRRSRCIPRRRARARQRRAL